MRIHSPKINNTQNKRLSEDMQLHNSFNSYNSYNILCKKYFLNNLYIKENILFNDKSSKKLLLSQIKDTLSFLLSKQNNVLSASKNKKGEYFKNILNELKQKLTQMMQKKEMVANYLVNKNKIKKKFLQKKGKKEMNNIPKNEINALKILNFTIENEIEKINSLINFKNNLTKYLKKLNIDDDNYEDYHFNQNENSKEINDIFISDLKDAKEKLNTIEMKGIILNSIIKDYNKEVNQLKQIIKVRNIISPNDIIFEETSENKMVITNDNDNDSNDDNNISTINNYNYDNSFLVKNEFDYLNNNINININSYQKNDMNYGMNINLNDHVINLVSKIINRPKDKSNSDESKNDEIIEINRYEKIYCSNEKLII